MRPGPPHHHAGQHCHDRNADDCPHPPRRWTPATELNRVAHCTPCFIVGGRQVAPAPDRVHAVRQIGHTKVETTKKFLRRLLAFILKAVSQAVSRLHAHEKTHEGDACETTKRAEDRGGPGLPLPALGPLDQGQLSPLSTAGPTNCRATSRASRWFDSRSLFILRLGQLHPRLYWSLLHPA